MKLDQATAVLRPRGAWEAVDLGCALARRHWSRIMRGWLPMALPLWAVIILLCHESAALAGFFIWLTKPVLTRQPVFFLSRALFGQPPAPGEFRKDWKNSLAKGLFASLTLRRLSFQRSFLLPVIMLEGQSGPGYNKRARVLSTHGGGSAANLAFTGLVLQLVITFGLSAWVASFIMDPAEDPTGTMHLFSEETPVWLAWLRTGFFAASIALIEPFYAAAGFALYINSRTHLEGWDIEVAFRRMSLRLLPAALIALLGTILFTTQAGAAPASGRDPKAVVQEVLKEPDFELEKRTVPVKVTKEEPEEKEKTEKSPVASSPGDLRWLGYVIIIVMALVVAFLIWQNRKGLKWGGAKTVPEVQGPRVVMGMDLAPESLPDDVPQVAWREFQAGRAREALRLLYRASLSWLVDRASLPVHESDTEGDCLRHARRLPDEGRVSSFEFLTSLWINCAYAGETPGEGPMKQLCDNWPFSLKAPRGGVKTGGGAAVALMCLLPWATLLLQGCSEPRNKGKIETEEITVGYRGAAKLNPWLAASRMFERMGVTTETRTALGKPPPVTATLFIPLEAISSRGSARQMLDWAARGGHLMVACSGTDRYRNDWRDPDDLVEDTASAFLKELDIEFSSERTRPVTSLTIDEESLALSHCKAPGLDLKGRRADVLAGSRDAASVASFHHGSGRVTLLASGTPFRNRYLDKDDNAAILHGLVTLDYGSSIIFVFSERQNLWEMLWQYAWMPFVAVVLLILLWLWRHLPRFGAARGVDHSGIRHFGTQLDEAGAFLSDRTGYETLLASARRAIFHAAAERGLNADNGSPVEGLAARTGLPAAEIEEALYNQSNTSDDIAAARTLQALQQHLGVTL